MNIAYDRTMYENDKPWMNKIKKGDYIYPIVYIITQKDGIKLWYSSKKKKCLYLSYNFKWIKTYPIIDKNGEYGLSTLSYDIY